MVIDININYNLIITSISNYALLTMDMLWLNYKIFSSGASIPV